MVKVTLLLLALLLPGMAAAQQDTLRLSLD